MHFLAILDQKMYKYELMLSDMDGPTDLVDGLK